MTRPLFLWFCALPDKVSTPELIPPTADYTVPEGTTMEDIFCR